MKDLKFRVWDGTVIRLPEYSDKEDFHIFPDGRLVHTTEYGYERHKLTFGLPKNWIVMQFIGIKDKNDKDIYEDDIVIGYDFDGNIKFTSKIEFYNGSFRTIIKGWDIKYEIGSWAIELEIIGNIHENKNLY